MKYQFTKANHYCLIKDFLDSRKDFVVLGLCGKTGSGCSTVANILQKSFEDMDLPVPSDSSSDSLEDHEYRILYNYARVHWRSFYRIKTSALITAHILKYSVKDFISFLSEFVPETIETRREKTLEHIVCNFFEAEMCFDMGALLQIDPSDVKEAWKWLTSEIYPVQSDGKQVEFTIRSDETISLGTDTRHSDESPSYIQSELELRDEDVQTIPFRCEEKSARCFFKTKDLYKLFQEYKARRLRKKSFDNPLLVLLLQQFIYNYLPNESARLWNNLTTIIPDVQVAALQQLGNHLRISGTPYGTDFVSNAYATIVVDINIAIKLLNASLVYVKKWMALKKTKEIKKRSLVVIDSIKNPFESMYLKDRYTNYYLLGVYTEDRVRWERLRRNQRLSESHIKAIDVIEQTKEFKRQRKKVLKLIARFSEVAPLQNIREYIVTILETCNDLEQEKCEELEACRNKLDKLWEMILPQDCFGILESIRKALKSASNCKKEYDDQYEELLLQTEHAADEVPDLRRLSPVVMDTIRIIEKYELSDELPFILQNVGECLETADIFINNKTDSRQYLRLKKKLIRYVSLIMNPGLVLPTPVERCMQLAYTAKLNSGCISRQVGAVITDAEYHLLSIGWNQQPEGQVPCTYRDLCSLYYHWSPEAYSEYECDDRDQVQEQIREPVTRLLDTPDSPLNIQGKLPAYCFKDIYNSIMRNDNQVHPRSLHGEETAFLNLGQYSARGGILFTTSSPCELCAKKAKYKGISKIYYIEPYSGISLKHVLNIGTKDSRPEMLLFTGAIGRAYTQLYTPLMPKKDELAFWLGAKVDVDLVQKIEEKAKKQEKKLIQRRESDETT